MINLLIETDRVELLAGEPKPVKVPRGGGKNQVIWRCPTCQTAGRVLKDRRMSRLLR